MLWPASPPPPRYPAVLVAIVQVTSDRMAGKKSVAKQAAVACFIDDGQECDEERDRANQRHDAGPAGKDSGP